MPRSAKRARLNPLGTQPSSLRKARIVTSQFHQLTHELKRVAEPARQQELEAQIQALGGREAYQNASRLAVSAFRSSRHVFKLLTQFGLRPSSGESPLNALEVGAINTHLCVPWLRVSGIDLMSRHPRIRQVDFFDIKPCADFDVLVNSMVINCVEDARLRGRMLLLCFAHLRPGGHLFLNLPRRCIENSKFITREMFESMLVAVGFEIRNVEMKPKIALYCCKKPGESERLNLIDANSSSNSTTAPAFSLPLLTEAEAAQIKAPKAIREHPAWLQHPVPSLHPSGTDFAVCFANVPTVSQ
jgi:25S rRNA (adenine2142-N1)-methyltransferase